MAVTENDPGALTVNDVELTLVILGAVFPGIGVTITVAEGTLVPPAPIAVTEQVYVVLLTRLVTVIGDTAAVPLPDGVQLAVYRVIAVPPVLAGAVKAIVACELPAVGIRLVGAPGAVGVIVTLCVTSVAAAKFASPA